MRETDRFSRVAPRYYTRRSFARVVQCNKCMTSTSQTHMQRTVNTRVTAHSHRAEFHRYVFEISCFPFYGRYDLDTFSQVRDLSDNNAKIELANYTLTSKWDTLRRTVRRCGSLLHEILCCPEIEEAICRMTYSDIFVRNGVAVPDGVYVTSRVAFGTDEPQKLHLKNDKASHHDLRYNILDIFYNLPLALFTVDGFANPVPDYERVDNVLAYGYDSHGPSNRFSPNICFLSHGQAAFLDSIPLQTMRGDATISVDANGYATPFQYFDIVTFLHELGQYNMGMEHDWLGDELSEYGSIRFHQPYVTFTMQMNGVDCERICSVGSEYLEESLPVTLKPFDLVADDDVLCG